MSPQEELTALRRMAELEAKASGAPAAPAPTPAPQQEQPIIKERGPSAWDRASKGDIVAGLPATRMVAGAVSPLVGALQVGANIGDWLSEKMGQDPVLSKYVAEKVAEYEASKKRGMAALGDTGADIGGAVGTMATGGAAVRGIAPATGWAGRVAQGAGVGAVAGATTPSATPGLEQTATQAGVGAALGGVVPAVAPLVAKGGRAVYRTIIEPMVDPASIKGRAYMEAAGAKAPEIINALRTNKPVVPGSLPTAGEAAISAGRPEFSAMQSSAEKVLPTNYLARSDARNAARLNQLGQVAGTEADMATAQGLRAATGKVKYGEAMTEGIDQDMAAAIKPQIDNLMERPVIQGLQRDAVKWAKDRGLGTPNFGSLEGLDYMKKALDRQITAQAKGTAAADTADLQTLMLNKADLLATIKQIAPKYDVARETFATQSKPINQMEVGQYLRNKLTSAVDETSGQRAASFAGAVRDAPGTLKRSLTGGPRYEKLSDVLTPDQVAKVESIRQDFANVARQELMAQKGAQAGPSAMDVASQSISGATGGGKIPNPLSRVVTIANAIIGRLEGRIDKKLAIEIATEMLDPKLVAAALEKEVAKGVQSAGKAVTINKLRLPATAAGTNAMIKGSQE